GTFGGETRKANSGNKTSGRCSALGFCLNAAYGRITSVYVRVDVKAVDMPLDAVDVFRIPPGHNAPQQ
ncbi:OLC1v1036227C1, partial [Oldenlandia corymbosa var. corymbosa]